MSAQLLDGKAVAKRMHTDIKKDVAALQAESGVTPGLATVLVGDDDASRMYVKMKHNRCADVGIESFGHEIPPTASQEEVEKVIDDLNADPRVHGILVQLPLPDHLDTEPILDRIAVHKDVDGLHPLNIGALAIKGRMPMFTPATPTGCLVLLREAELLIDSFSIEGANAVVLGRSNLVGMPMALLLVENNATVTVAHSRTRDLQAVLADADIVVSAVGRPHMVPGEWIKHGAVVIDVATVKVDDPSAKKGYRWVGDVEPEEAMKRAAAMTPVPGGVGPMTVAMLLQNTLNAARRYHA
ncbi:MAG: bifunctional 5,10-methylenetetrahydrofolate dehydrogenase/5,10-methenyltetrahydrofolate cyclohydrolase [Chloroflexi bacterium]|nr:bifunctional 5,10-methylenetetrahydrofolate dehydrogenase/5,10-methenyltetrahydrofolate cyclohydrolase [Chloroflexota bacterium]